MWLITMILFTPCARNASICCAAAVSSPNTVPGSGLDDCCVLLAMVRPTRPMDWPSRCSTMEGLTRPGAREGFSAELAPKVTLALSTGVWQAPLCSRSMKRFRPLSPLSNSWLPNVMASKQTVFIMAASASPGSPARLKQGAGGGVTGVQLEHIGRGGRERLDGARHAGEATGVGVDRHGRAGGVLERSPSSCCPDWSDDR